MVGADNADRAKVPLKLSPQDIRTIRSGLRVLLQIHTREEGYQEIRQALADLPSDEDLAHLEVDDELQALACACREAGLDGERGGTEPCSGREAALGAGAQSSRARITFPIAGLQGGGEGALIAERALQEMPGVLRAYVNPATEMAYVEFDPARTDQNAFERVISSLGYRTVTVGRSS